LAEKITAEIVANIVESQMLLNPTAKDLGAKVEQLKGLSRVAARKLDMLREYE